MNESPEKQLNGRTKGKARESMACPCQSKRWLGQKFAGKVTGRSRKAQAIVEAISFAVMSFLFNYIILYYYAYLMARLICFIARIPFNILAFFLCQVVVILISFLVGYIVYRGWYEVMMGKRVES